MRVFGIFTLLCLGGVLFSPLVAKKTLKKNHTLVCTQKLSMAEAVRLAHIFRPAFCATVYNIDSFRALQKRELAAYFPQLSLSISENFEKREKGIGNATSLQGSQLIYDPAGPQVMYKIAGKNVEIAKSEYEIEKKDVRLEVELAFLSAWLLQEQYNQVQSRKVSAQATYAVAKHSYTEGLLDKNVFLQGRSTFAQNRTIASAYKEDVLIALGELSRTIGVPFKVSSLAWDPEAPICLSKDVGYYIQYAMRRRDIIKAKQSEIEREQRRARLNIAKYAPNVSLVGFLNRNSFITPATPKLSEEIGISIGWNLFDGLAHYRDYQAAQASTLRATMEKQSLIQQVEQDVKAAYYQTKQAIKYLKAQDVTLDQAKNQLILAKQQLAIGTATQTDVEAARFTFEDVKFTWLQKRITVEKTWRTLLRVSEYPPESE